MNSPSSTDPARLALRTPEDVLAKVPFLVGFHPKESLVALVLGPDRNVLFTLRVDLPSFGDGPSATAHGGAPDGRRLHAYAGELVHLLLRRGGELTLLVAYTARPERAGPVVAVVRTACEDAGVDVLDVLVADGRRWWSDACADPRCCPPDGTPYDLAEHPITAHSVFAGEVALADEEAVHHLLAPVAEPEQPRLRSIAERVRAEVGRRVAAGGSTDGDQHAGHVGVARDYLIPLIRSFAAGACRLTDEHAARAAVLVTKLPVRDEVWAGMSRSSARGDVAFWTEVLRRTVAPYDVAPATLLAFAAWLDGGGALARCAIERALASDPYYSMAHLVGELLAGAVPPEAWSVADEAA